MPPRGNLEKKALSMGVSKILDLTARRPGRTVLDQLLEEPQLTGMALTLAVDVHPGTHG